MARWDSAFVATPRVCLTKVPFLASFWPDMDTERGVAIYMYLKHPPDDSDSKYIEFIDLTHQVQVLVPKYHFWPHTMRERGVAPWDPAHVTPRVKWCMHTKF